MEIPPFYTQEIHKVSAILYIFFWVFPRRQIVVGRRFGTLYQLHFQRLGVHCTPSLWRWNWYRVPKCRPTTIWRRGNTQKKIYNIQITAKVWNQEYQQFLFQLLQQQAGLTFGNNETQKPFNTLQKVPFMTVHQLHLDCDHGRTVADLHQGSTKGFFLYGWRVWSR